MFRARRSLLIALLVAVVLHQPLRDAAWWCVRLPLTVLETALHVLVELPSLPRWRHERAMLRAQLTARELELSRAQEALHRLTVSHELSQRYGSRPGLAVSVIGRDLLPTEHVLLLNRGARHGVQVDGVLVDAQGLVGRIIEVQPTTSVAMLLTDPDSRVAALIERSRELGLVVGRGGSSCRLLHLDADADIAVDDRVITAGVGGPFPQGLAIGTVVKVLRDERAAETVAWVRPAVKAGRLEELWCLAPSSASSSPAP